jgi:hypothetical protein
LAEQESLVLMRLSLRLRQKYEKSFDILDTEPGRTPFLKPWPSLMFYWDSFVPFIEKEALFTVFWFYEFS